MTPEPEPNGPDPRWAGVALIAFGLCASLLSGFCTSTFGELDFVEQATGAFRLFAIFVLVGLFLILRKWDR